MESLPSYSFMIARMVWPALYSSSLTVDFFERVRTCSVSFICRLMVFFFKSMLEILATTAVVFTKIGSSFITLILLAWTISSFIESPITITLSPIPREVNLVFAPSFRKEVLVEVVTWIKSLFESIVMFVELIEVIFPA